VESNNPSPGELVADDVAWEPWSPEEVAQRLASVKTRWYVVAGWALDLFQGRQTRTHDDIEIGVPADGFDDIRGALSSYEFDVVGSGRRWPLADQAFGTHFQTWARDPRTNVYHLDVFRDPHDGETWLCRRNQAIRVPYDNAVRFNDDAIPYMSPEIVLLFKAKATREKDQTDFEAVLPLLNERQVEWLRTNLRVVHPGHPWLSTLSRT
jgi:hypothetical protein